MVCVECKKEIVKNVGSAENPLCEQCYGRMSAEYGTGGNRPGDGAGSQIKPGVDPFMLLGFFVCVVATVVLFFASEHGQFLGILGAAFSLICLTGLIVSATHSSNTGPVLVIIGCIFFIPIGLIGVFGAQRAMKEMKSRLSQ